MKKFLFLAHYFPPIGGAGVQRSAKFVKHLPGLGMMPVVLTGEGKPGNRWTPEDKSLLSDVPPEVPVIRVPVVGTEEMSREQRSRLRQAAFLETGSKAILEHQLELIFVTMSPFDDALIAAELARRHRIPWVADLRDPWALDEFQVYPTFWHRWRERRKMEAYLRSASSVIMNTPEAMRKFRSAFPALASKAHVSITNGYDAEEFPAVAVTERNSKFTLVHSGYLHTEAGLRQRRLAWQYRLLGRIENGVKILPRSHFYLLRALEDWLREDPSIAKSFRAVLVGVPSPADEALVRESPARDMVTFTGYLPHAECVQRVLKADLLFMPMHQVPDGSRSSIVPGKAYEYMATRRPILAAVPEGDAREFLQAAGTARVCCPDDSGQLLKALKACYLDWRTGVDASLRWNAAAVNQFDRARLTERLRNSLCEILAACDKQ